MGVIRLANAPCSWGSLEFDGLESDVIGYAQMLDELVETGYRGTELGDWGYMPNEPDALAAELGRRDVALVGAFVPVALSQPEALEPGCAEAVKVARLLAAVFERRGGTHAPFLVLADDNGSDETRTTHAGRVELAMGLSDAQWATFAEGTEAIARAVKSETGLRTVFHHHCAGYVETSAEVDRLLAMTDPEWVGLVFDTGHFLYGSGANDSDAVAAALERFADRIGYVHFKDCHAAVADRARREGWDYFEAVRQGVFCELGQGQVDFPAVLAWLYERDYDGWVVVEQDVLPGMGQPKESAQRNRTYLQSLGV